NRERGDRGLRRVAPRHHSKDCPVDDDVGGDGRDVELDEDRPPLAGEELPGLTSPAGGAVTGPGVGGGREGGGKPRQASGWKSENSEQNERVPADSDLRHPGGLYVIRTVDQPNLAYS